MPRSTRQPDTGREPRAATRTRRQPRHDPEGIAPGLWSTIDAVRRGLPVAELTAFQHETRLPPERIYNLLRLSSRTLARRRLAGRLNEPESERLLRLRRVHEQVLRLCGDNPAQAARWLETPNWGLGGRSPLELLETEVGAREVERLIGQTEHGIVV